MSEDTTPHNESDKEPLSKVTVIGDGGWGTTLAIHLSKNKHPVKLWGAFPKYIERVAKNRYNPKFLPGVKIPQPVDVTGDLKNALDDADVLVFAVPSKYAEDVLKQIRQTGVNMSEKIFLSVTKGLETRTCKRISELVKEHLGDIPFAVLSGPTIAREVAVGIPSTAAIASEDRVASRALQKIFHSDTFRIYTNTDVIGTELGGSLKNVIAIACGVCDGLGYGSNTKAALLTRGIAEMKRLGKAMGARSSTFSGLSGLGDLVTTAFSPQSRNRTVGEKLGKGKKISEITDKMDMVAEGVDTVEAVLKLAGEHHIEMPICLEVHNMIYEHKKAQDAVKDLMSRQAKAE